MRPLLFPLRSIASLVAWTIAAVAGVPELRSAGVYAQMRFHATRTATGEWIVDERPSVLPGADPTFTHHLESVLAGYRPGSETTATLPFWLAQTYRDRFAVLPATRTFRPATENTWTVSVPFAPAHVTKLRVVVRTTAIPQNAPAASVSWQPPSQSAVNETTRTLWENTTIELEPSGPVGRKPAPDAPALATIYALARAAAVQIALRYGENQNSYRERVTQDLQRLAQERQLGPPYHLAISTSPVTGDTLVVRLLGLDPIVHYTARIDQIDLPTDHGSHPTRDELVRAYGDNRLTRDLIARMDALQNQLQQELDGRARPEFLSGDSRASLAAALEQEQRFRHLEGANPSASSTAPDLLFPGVYRPASGTLTAALSGDSVRSLRGNLSLSYAPLWRLGDMLTAKFAPGTDGLGAGAHYTFPVRDRIFPLLTGKFDSGIDYDFSRDNRLGTRSGPTVSLADRRAGATYTLAHDGLRSPIGVLSVHNEFSLAYRDLHSTADPHFLGGVDGVRGPAIADELAATATTNSGRPDRWEIGASLKATEWLSQPVGNFLSIGSTAHLRRIFGDDNGPVFFVELRGGAGSATAAMPRIAFSRLGGDTWMRGMQNGEMAGRHYRVAAVAAGPSVRALWQWISRNPAAAVPAAMQSLFLEGFTEAAAVSGRSGAEFDSPATAQSYGVGVRGLDLIPHSSITAGYAWSPQAIRPSGRFFVSLFVLLQR
jgi:hypothetical protein